jgi:hypothetical protein
MQRIAGMMKRKKNTKGGRTEGEGGRIRQEEWGSGGGGGGKVWTLKRERDNGGIWEWWGICAVDRYNDGGGCYMRGERGVGWGRERTS